MSDASIDKVEELRRAFDESFTAAPTAAEESVDLLAVRVGGDAYALRVSEVSSLWVDKKIVPLPSAHPLALGLAGIRGSLVVVYSLAGALGAAVMLAPSPWIAVLAGDATIGLAFHELDGFLRVPRRLVFGAERRGANVPGHARHVNAIARMGDRTRPVVDSISIASSLHERGGAGLSTREQER